jgi:origin recognition complex subunit 5
MATLPLEVQQSLRQSCPSRGLQINQLASFYNVIQTDPFGTPKLIQKQAHFPSPPILVTYGLEGTGKLKCITSVLEARARTHAVVKCADCLSQRHLLSKIFAACIVALGEAEHVEKYGKIDKLNSLVVNLQRLFESTADGGQFRKLVLVLNGIDEQRGGTATLLPMLGRLPGLMPDRSALSLILVSNFARPPPLHLSGLAYLHFPPYTRNEAISIITNDPPPLQPDFDERTGLIPVDDSVLLPIYTQFCTTVYDSLIALTSISLSTFRTTCITLWPAFIWPLLSNEQTLGKSKPWTIQRLLIRNRALFQTTGEATLVSHFRPLETPTFQSLTSTSSTQTPPSPLPLSPPLLKPFPTLLLLSCYLASHTNAKVDILLFSRLSSSSKSSRTRKNYHKRKHLKAASASFADTAAEKNALKASKKLFDAKSGVGRPFGLERVVAILRAVHPEGVKGRRGVGDRVYRGVGELVRLGLVRGVEGGEEGERLWRVDVRRGWVDGLVEKVGLGVRVGEYEVQGE